jgi:hypothetical protein
MGVDIQAMTTLMQKLLYVREQQLMITALKHRVGEEVMGRWVAFL